MENSSRWPPSRTSLYLSAMRRRLATLSDDNLLLSSDSNPIATPEGPSFKSECLLNKEHKLFLHPAELQNDLRSSAMRSPLLRFNASGNHETFSNAFIENDSCAKMSLENYSSVLHSKYQIFRSKEQDINCFNIADSFCKRDFSSLGTRSELRGVRDDGPQCQRNQGTTELRNISEVSSPVVKNDDDDDSLILSLSSSDSDGGAIRMKNKQSGRNSRQVYPDKDLATQFKEALPQYDDFNFHYYTREIQHLLHRIQKVKAKAQALALKFSV